MRDYRLILAELEHRRGIDTTYVVPIRGVILDEKIPKLKYDDSILVDKQEGLAKAIRNCLTRHIRKIPVFHKETINKCHKDVISYLDFTYF